jgi:hypothetical protein
VLCVCAQRQNKGTDGPGSNDARPNEPARVSHACAQRERLVHPISRPLFEKDLRGKCQEWDFERWGPWWRADLVVLAEDGAKDGTRDPLREIDPLFAFVARCRRRTCE